VIEAFFNDIESAFRSSFFSNDWRTIAIALAAAAVAGLIMSRRGQMASVTLLALFLFAAGGFLRNLLAPRGEGVSLFDRAGTLVEAGVMQILDMQAGLLIGYFIAFAVVVLAVFGLKSAAGGGH